MTLTTTPGAETATPADIEKIAAALPPLDSPYPLTPDQIAAFQRDGFAVLRQVASPDEIAAYRPAITDATMRYNIQTTPLGERTDTYSRAFLQVPNLWERDAAVARFTLARRFAQIAADLMGVAGVRIYHDQALYKEAGGGHTPWHQDQQYWPLDGAKCVTLWMPLVDADESMGTMRFAQGSQALGYLGPLNISDDSETKLSELIQNKGFSLAHAGAMRAGDATFHDGWTLHGAPGNSSANQTREVMTIIYIEDGARITPPDSKSRENDLARWFAGLKPGDLAAGTLNPLAYSREE